MAPLDAGGAIPGSDVVAPKVVRPSVATPVFLLLSGLPGRCCSVGSCGCGGGVTIAAGLSATGTWLHPGDAVDATAVRPFFLVSAATTLVTGAAAVGAGAAVVRAYGAANGLDVIELDPRHATIGIAATGTTFDSVRQALADLGADDFALHRAGVRLLRIGMPTPLGPDTVVTFTEGLEEILVVEDKTAFVETQVREILYILERHETQYFEMFCNRGIYHKGWSAVTKHRTPWEMAGMAMPAFDDDVWELYDGNTDWTQSKDLSKENPQKLHELQRLWLIEAVKYNVLPLDDRQIERFIPEQAGRPTLIKGNTQLLFGGMGRLSESSVVDIKNKSFAVTSELEVPADGAEGVIIAQGGRFGGWSLYAKDGRAKFYYNVLGITSFGIDATEPIPIGTTQVRMEFAYDGGGMGKGGDVTLYCDGKEVGNGRVDRTQGVIFSADETTDVGRETGTTVSPDYTAHTSKFSGKFTGCRSIWARTLPTPTTTSTRRNASGLRWRDSRSALQ